MRYDFQSINCYAESVCGDSFLCERGADGYVMVASDGLGHGTVANVLSELTCETVMSEWRGTGSLSVIMSQLAASLPVGAVSGRAYATFALVDYNDRSGRVTLVEYDTPHTLFFRGADQRTLNISPYTISLPDMDYSLRVAQFTPRAGDRLIYVSDGLTQSGLGTTTMPFGWGENGASAFISQVLFSRLGVSPAGLCDRLLNRALGNECNYAHDDMSVLTIEF
ncbi:MAG: SpoIIE family protein phosphatase [Mucinivorans sp.]